MLKEYCGPGAGGSESEITHRFISELLDDCDVIVSAPDIEGDKSYYRIMKKMHSGAVREVMLQGWDLDSVAADSIVEMRDIATSAMEKIVGHSGDQTALEEKFALIKDVSARLCAANAEVEHEVSERYWKMMREHIEKSVKNNNTDGGVEADEKYAPSIKELNLQQRE